MAIKDDEGTQLPVARLKEDTVIRVAHDVGIRSEEVVCLIVCRKNDFIATAHKDVIVQDCPGKKDYVDYQPRRHNREDIIRHVITEIDESLRENRPFLSVYYTPDVVRICVTDPDIGHRESFFRRP